MQPVTNTWKALAARIGSPGFPITHALSLYSGNSQIYSTGNQQRIVMYSGNDVVFDSDNDQTIQVYSGDALVYTSGLVESGNTVILETRVTIGGTDRSVEVCTAPVINRATMQNGLSVGNVVSATCMLTLRTSASIARSAAVEVEMRLTDGSTTSEWRPAGTFYISRRTKDPITGLLTLECYDALLKANAVWTPSAGAWPRSMSAVVSELAPLIGVSVDSRTTLITGNDYVIDEPADGTTVRDVLSDIAACNGGNWIITPSGNLRLVPLKDAADAGDAVSDALDVVAVLDRGTVGDTAAVTGVRCTVDGMVTLTGDDTGIVVDVGIAPVIAADLAQTLIGMTHQPFRLPSAVYDPAVELGDYVRYGDTVAGVLCAETVTLSQGPRGELCAPDPAELADEYPYIGGAEKALTLAKAYAREAMEALDDDLTQQEIFNRLTNNGAAQGMVLLNGQLYVNASYIHSGTLVLGGLNNVNGTMEVLDASGNVVGTITKDGIFTGNSTSSAVFNSGILKFEQGNDEVGRIWPGALAGGSNFMFINGPESSGSQNRSALNFWGNGDVSLLAGDEVAALDLHADGSIGINSSDDISTTADGDISETADGTLHLHSGGDASLYLTDAGHVEIRSDGGAAYLQLKADGTIYVNNAAEWRSALGIELHELVLTSQTVDANGNIDTDLNAGNYVVVSARCSSYIVTPWVSGSTTTWWVHLTTFTGGAVSSGTSVGTVRVYYYDL